MNEELNRRAQPVAQAADLDSLIASCSEAAQVMRNASEPLDPSVTYDPFKELMRRAYWMGVEQALAAQPPAEPAALCRQDGRCQYAIDHGAEGMGHCPVGKCAMSATDAEPVAWIRFCSDGSYEGPLMNFSIEEVRKKSGAWTPLFAHPPRPEPLTDSEIKSLFEVLQIAVAGHDTPLEMFTFLARSVEAAIRAKGEQK
jgi:hypothetical protein